jgi:hypothetical protein
MTTFLVRKNRETPVQQAVSVSGGFGIQTIGESGG